MGNKLNISVKMDDSGVKEYIKLVESNNFTKENIAKCLQSSAYTTLIKLGGRNIGMENKLEWIDIFYEALNASEIDIEIIYEKYRDDFIKSSIYKGIYESSRNIEKVQENNTKLIKIVETENFINNCAKYAPSNRSIKEITISSSIFGLGGFGVENHVIIDNYFLNIFTETQIENLLSHELHHIIYDNVEKNYNVEHKYKLIPHILSWLSYEGMADLNNFHSDAEFREKIGLVKPGRIAEMLSQVDSYLEKINKMFKAILEETEFDKEFFMKFQSEAAYHPVGYTMANRIIEVAGIDALVSCIGDRLKFFNLYNECCNKNPEFYKFNEAVIKGINKLLNSPL